MSNNHQRIELLFNKNRNLLLNIAQRYVPDSDLAQDVLQQTFTEFLGRYEKKGWPLTEEIVPLLVQMAKFIAHRVRKNAEKHQGKAFQRIETHLLNYYQLQEEPKLDTENSTVEQLHLCLDRLSPKNRQMIELRYFLDHSTKDIAAIYHVEENTVFKSLARIRIRLKECISSFLQNH